MPLNQPITATPINEIGFPPKTKISTAIEVLKRMGMIVVPTARGELIAVRLH